MARKITKREIAYRRRRYVNLTEKDLFAPAEARDLMLNKITSRAMKAFRRKINKERYPRYSRMLNKFNGDDLAARRELYDELEEEYYDKTTGIMEDMYNRYNKLSAKYDKA